MAIKSSDQRRLCLRSGGRCAFPGCRRILAVDAPQDEAVVVLGEMAHIVADSGQGPRADPNMPREDRDKYENLILLCNVHHQLVDSAPETYTVPRLHAMKDDHERWVEEQLGECSPQEALPRRTLVESVLYSNVLPVEVLPRRVFGVSCDLEPREVRARMGPLRKGEAAPYIVKERKVWAFQDPRLSDNPFANLAQGVSVDSCSVEEWWDDDARIRWFVELLNRTLHKITGRRGLRFDHEHRRYYFPPLQPGKPRTETFKPLHAGVSSRDVVWEPTRKSTGQGRGFWIHRAISLRFVRSGSREWCLALRPEFRVTADGEQPLPSQIIGRRVTRKMARMFNNQFLAEVHFWREYLGQGRPRIAMNFGSSAQRLQISMNFLDGDVEWPGLPQDREVSFGNATYQEDLFSRAELAEFEAGDEDHDDDDDLDPLDDEGGEP